MAWHFARLSIAWPEAASRIQAPLFVNAALIVRYNPYNTQGGPVPPYGVWRAARQIDFLAPIFTSQTSKWVSQISEIRNPLFIPEASPSRRARQRFYAIGQRCDRL